MLALDAVLVLQDLQSLAHEFFAVSDLGSVTCASAAARDAPIVLRLASYCTI